MRRRLMICLLVAAGALLKWGLEFTVASQLFDDARSREEIDMMRVILSTTLDHKLKGSRESSDDGAEQWGLIGGKFSSQINGYYLYGQGAVFTISLNLPPVPPAPPIPPIPAVAPAPPAPAAPAAPAPPAPVMGEMSDDSAIAALAAANDKVAAELAAAASKEAELASTASKDAQKQAEAARAQMKLHEKNLAKQLEKVQEQTKYLQDHFKHWRVQQEADRAKIAERITAAKGVLMEALAKHGDSLTVVKPQEYITLILSGDSGKWFWLGTEEKQTPKQILSVQKSVIGDYKAGKLTLEDFKKKVLSYTN